MGLKMKLPEQPKPEFDETQRFDNYFIGDTQVIPKANISGSRRTNTPEVELPEGSVFLNNQIDQAQGNVGLGFVTPSGIEFGGDVRGNYTKGEVKYPQELQNYGAPESEKYGGGMTIDELQGYINVPVTDNLSVSASGGVNPYYRDEQGNKNIFGQLGLRYNF